MIKRKILIIAAHPDDEILGAGGTILKHIKNGDEINVLILGDGETSRDIGADIFKREKQARKIASILRFKSINLEKLPDNRFDSLPLLDIVKKVEKIVNEVEPDIVYTHWRDDLNIDHCITFEAVLTACRPKPGFCVKEILSFEVPSSTEWQVKDASHVFCPNEYVDISDMIDTKLGLLQIYSDELCEYPHPRSVEGVKILAQYRGIEAGLRFAEAFFVVRKIR